MTCCAKKKPCFWCCEYPNCFVSCLLGGFGRLRSCCAPSKRCVDKKISYTLLISEDEDGIAVTRTIVWGRNDISISKFQLSSVDSLWFLPEMDRCKQIRCSQIFIVSSCADAFNYDHLEKIASIFEEAPTSALEKLDKLGITLSLSPDARVIQSLNRIIAKLPTQMKRIELNFLGATGDCLALLNECLRLNPKLIKVQTNDIALESVVELMEDNYNTKLWIKVNFGSDRPVYVVQLMEQLQKKWQDSDQLHQNGVEVQFSAPLSVWEILPAENYLYKSEKTKKFAPMYAQLRCIFERQAAGVFGRVALYMGLEGKENKSLAFGVKARY